MSVDGICASGKSASRLADISARSPSESFFMYGVSILENRDYEISRVHVYSLSRVGLLYYSAALQACFQTKEFYVWLYLQMYSFYIYGINDFWFLFWFSYGCIMSVAECLQLGPASNVTSCFEFPSITASWRSAQQTCDALGGHLAVDNDATLHAYLGAKMASFNWRTAWIGANDTEHPDWLWTDGVALGNRLFKSPIA